MKRIASLMLAWSTLCTAFLGCTPSKAPDGMVSETETAAPSEVTYVTKPVSYTEPGGSYFGMKTYMETATVGSVTYSFEKCIPETDRAACMEQTAAWLGKLNTERELRIYVYSDSTYDSDYVADGAIYTHTRDWQSIEYGIAILRGLFGEFCNYGMAYGYANYLRGQSDTSSRPFDGDFAYYDLNDLCFHPDFVSTEDLEAVRAIANLFVSEYIATNGVPKFHEILTLSGSVTDCGKANEVLEEFYASKGIETELSTVLYGFGGRSYDYSAACEYAEFYVVDDWVDTSNAFYPDFEVYDGYLNSDYVKTKAYFETNIEQMKQYQNLFNCDEYDHGVEITFSNDLVFSEVSCYLPSEHRIHVTSIVSLMHEYIHSLTSSGSIGEKWSVEGLATYYSSAYNAYAIPFWEYDCNTSAENHVQQFREKLGREFDPVQDLVTLDHVMVYCHDQYDPNISYGAGSSFMHYLVTRFGERSVLDYILKNHDLSTLTELSFEEMVLEWRTYIETNYSDYKKCK